jgi:hypothetical protein
MKDQRPGAVFDTFYRERRVAAAIDATPIARKEKINQIYAVPSAALIEALARK